MPELAIDPARLRALNDAPVRSDGRYVLYWMVGARRTRTNPALAHAIARARELKRPLLVFEPLRAGYRWSSPRLHRFVMDGMEDNEAAFEAAGVRYLRWLEPRHGEGAGLLEALAAEAAMVVTDDTPCFFLPRMVQAAAARLVVRCEAVDGVGLLPLSAHPRAFPTAHSFRRHLQKTVGPHLHRPTPTEPLAGYDLGWAPLPEGLSARWPSAERLEDVQLQHPTTVVGLRGGERAGQRRVDAFLDGIGGYLDRNHPDEDVASGLSPYLHFGHVSAEEVARRALATAGWSAPASLPKATGSRGWWSVDEATDGFLDELVTWRELSWGFAHHRADHDRFEAIPDWARQTLADHAGDPRELVSFERLEAARSPDPLWNAAQRQLLTTGTMHNYLRMLWGKLVLAWAPTPQVAFDWLLELNDRYALDGRDPNSTAGVGWVFGRHDRAWGPERPIYGKVRYMTSRSTRAKLRLSSWLARFGA